MPVKKVISGIQQIGVGVKDVHEAWKWFRKHLGMDIEVFEEEATATLMTPHTNNKLIPRHAVLAMNMQGGGGFEIWQQTKYTPLPPEFELKLGDLGIFICKMKCKNAAKMHARYKENSVDLIGGLVKDPKGKHTFYFRDPFGNIFQMVESDNWYRNENKDNGGAYGAIIGVSDIDKALKLYQEILDHDEIVYDVKGIFEDLEALPGGKAMCRRVLLTNSKTRKGAFGKLLGSSQIELIQVIDTVPQKIFKDRIWGDLGYIHLCFDVRGMDLLKKECADNGLKFTVDSADSFDMGVAAGRFAYIEDADGTLIEFVETHKVPILKKIGWYMNLNGRDPEKYLPNWMVNTLAWNRKKD